MERIQGYTLLQEMGSGSFGRVERAALDNGDQYAMKIMYPNLKEMADDEIRVLSSLRHPFILEFKEHFQDPKGGNICIITELCKEDLRKRLKRHQESKEYILENDLFDWLTMATLALRYLHEQKPPITHRDIKPENLLLTAENETLKVADFGLAARLFQKTEEGYFGTRGYIAPEFWTSDTHNERCDIWSLGQTFRELCNLEGPDFNFDNYTIPPRYSSDLQNIIQLMLEKNPKTRPTAKELTNMPAMQLLVKRWGKRLEAEELLSPAVGNPSGSSGRDSACSGSSGCSEVSVSHVSQPILTSETRKSVSQRSQGEQIASLQAILDMASKMGEAVVEQTVHRLIYCDETKTIYVTDKNVIVGYKWNSEKQPATLETVFFSKFNGEIQAFALAPKESESEVTPSFYLSIGFGEELVDKSVIKVSGESLDKIDSSLETCYIDEKCLYWELASNPKREILLIHPFFSSTIYIQVKNTPCGSVDLNQLGIHKGISQMELANEMLILGNFMFSYVYTCHFEMHKLPQSEEVTVSCTNPWGPVCAPSGAFGSVSIDVTGNERYVIVKKGETSALTFKCGDDPKNPFRKVNIKANVTIMGVMAQNETTLLLVGKNADNCLCALELKESRNKTKGGARQLQAQKPDEPSACFIL